MHAAPPFLGSLYEVESHLIIAQDQHFLTEEAFASIEPTLVEARQTLQAFMRSLRVED